jgi:hypothetical protein
MDPEGMENWHYVHDCLEHMWLSRDHLELHKITKRRAINQAAYGFAKVFGHRSDYHDLNVTVPDMQKLPGKWGSDLWALVPGPTNLSIYWQLHILGGESLKAQHSTKSSDRLNANILTANQIDINLLLGSKYATVDMNLTGQGLLNLCGDLGKMGLGRALAKMIAKKWGSVGDLLGKNAPLPFGREAPGSAPQIEEGKEGRYVLARWVNGTPKVKTGAFGWMSATG